MRTSVLLSPDELNLKLGEVVARLKDAFGHVEIYFFGSYAEGRAASDSDLDLLVVVPDSDLDPFERDAKAYRALCGLGIAKDVQVYTRQEFENQANLPGSLAHTVKTRGRVIYAG